VNRKLNLQGNRYRSRIFLQNRNLDSAQSESKINSPHKTLYNRFVRWAEKGVWDKLFHHLAAAGGPPAAVMIDATHIKAHRSSSGGKGGPRRRRSAVHAAGGPPRSTRLSMNKAGPDN